jgi:hypothetical protein
VPPEALNEVGRKIGDHNELAPLPLPDGRPPRELRGGGVRGLGGSSLPGGEPLSAEGVAIELAYERCRRRAWVWFCFLPSSDTPVSAVLPVIGFALRTWSETPPEETRTLVAPVSMEHPVIGFALRRLATDVRSPASRLLHFCDAPVSAVLPVIGVTLPWWQVRQLPRHHY